MRQAVIVDGTRTMFFNAKESLPGLTARKLGAVPLKELMRRYPEIVNAKYLVGANVGNQLSPPDGSNIARLIALDAGFPKTVGAHTVNLNCGSGLRAVMDAAVYVEAGMDCVPVIAVEVMSDYTAFYPRDQRLPIFTKEFLENNRKMPAWKKAFGKIKNRAALATMKHRPHLMLKTGLTDPYCGLGMDKVGDKIAEHYKISREELDLYALESQRRAAAAQERNKKEFARDTYRNSRIDPEIIPFKVGDGELIGRPDLMQVIRDIDVDLYDWVYDRDNGVRKGQDAAKLKKLSPLNPGGTVTAGNASQVSDGAVAMLVAEKEYAKAMGWPILAECSFEESVVVGGDPELMGVVPAMAIDALLKKKRSGYWSLKNFGVIETNEAFASVVLAQSRILDSLGWGEYPRERTNPNGGAIAIGHPVGASGARLALTAILEARRKKQELALATACIGGGQGVAMIFRIAP